MTDSERVAEKSRSEGADARAMQLLARARAQHVAAFERALTPEEEAQVLRRIRMEVSAEEGPA